MTDCMLALRAKETKWWMSPLEGQLEREQNGWVTLSQHPAGATSVHHSSLELNSVAKTNKKSSYYCWNYTDLSPPLLLKRQHADWNVHFRNEGKKIKAFLCSSVPLVENSFQILITDLMKSQSSWDIFQWQDAEGIYLNSTEQKVLRTSSPTKGFRRTWWMLISHLIYTGLTPHCVPNASHYSSVFLRIRWRRNNKLIEILTHRADVCRGSLLFLSWWVLFWITISN